MQCEVGLRKKTYNVLTGSVLSVWNEVESILTQDGNRKGTNSRMQVCATEHVRQLSRITIAAFSRLFV